LLQLVIGDESLENVQQPLRSMPMANLHF
jgi:hypothetical protein